MHVSAPRFDWSFNFGHVLNSITVAITIGGFVFWASGKIENFERRIAASEERARVYGPLVTGLVKSNDVQDERINNLSDAFRGIRTDITENNRQLRAEFQEFGKNIYSLREVVAELKATRNTREGLSDTPRDGTRRP